MRTVRISDLRRGHLRAGFVPWLKVGFFPRSESAGCTIVTIEPSLVRTDFPPVLYICALRAHSGSCPSGLLYQEPPCFWSRLKFWRTIAE